MEHQAESELMQELGLVARNHQFPIATKVRESFEIQGTCVAIGDGKNHFLVTASHVTNLRHDAADHELYLFNWLDNKFIRIEEDIVGYNEVEIPREFDVSIIKIQRDRFQAIPDENFLRPEAIFVDRGESLKSLYALSGFPASKNRSFPKYISAPRLLCFFTDKITEKREANALNSNNSFTLALKYDHPDAPDAYGMSGGALWILTTELPRNPALAGILVSWHRGENTIFAVKMDFIISIIKGFFPGSRFDDIPTAMLTIENGEKAYLCIPAKAFASGEVPDSDI
ncbi:serine protease [Achromobacter xylosoxidans]|uniref:serine protease n=1 Tax=Alcaligenes xylosoxydans xylosoxydans TaxID=85698 RepID=UPI001F142E4B|nr:serine protease [Achromobacter xylosoxidans]